MKLITAEISEQLTAQYPKGAELEGQNVIVKLFDPSSSWTWYLINQDPEDLYYLWGIVKGFEIEIGSINLAALEEYRGRLGKGIERDLSFTPIPAKEVWERLLKGEHI
jgi:hypothetical protein